MRANALSATLLIAALCALPRPAVGQAATRGWVDPSPHKVGYVTVARGVRVHYLDWGGTGEPLVFLTGIGNTAHSFDDLAPLFTDRFRVIAITRRGQGESSKPKEPYDIATLTNDIRTVLDSLKITSANFAGHSFGGQELTHLAGAYPARVKKLVYLDAAFDYFFGDTLYAKAQAVTPLINGPPGPTPRDCASVDAFIAYSYRTFGVRIPEGEFRTTFVRLDGGSCGRQGAILDDYQSGMLAGVEHEDYRAVKAPALALCAVRDAISQEEPWAQRDALYRANYDSIRTLYAPIDRLQRQRFAREVANSKVVEVRGAHHWIFVSHRDRVVQEMRAFLLGAG
jgi:pimeloyl-ACP methyl ester carboxylesterase